MDLPKAVVCDSCRGFGYDYETLDECSECLGHGLIIININYESSIAQEYRS